MYDKNFIGENRSLNKKTQKTFINHFFTYKKYFCTTKTLSEKIAL